MFTHEEFKNNRDLKSITKTFLFIKWMFLIKSYQRPYFSLPLIEQFLQLDHPRLRSTKPNSRGTIRNIHWIDTNPSFNNASKSTGTKPRIMPRPPCSFPSFPRFSLALCPISARFAALSITPRHAKRASVSCSSFQRFDTSSPLYFRLVETSGGLRPLLQHGIRTNSWV